MSKRNTSESSENNLPRSPVTFPSALIESVNPCLFFNSFNGWTFMNGLRWTKRMAF